MITKKIGDFTGTSTSGINEAIDNALEQAGDHNHFEVVETSSSLCSEKNRHYQVTLSTFGD